MKHSRIIHQYWTSPCGILDLASIAEELVMCDWADGWHRAATLNRTAAGVPFLMTWTTHLPSASQRSAAR